MGAVAQMTWSPKYEAKTPDVKGCEACGALRESLRMCLGALAKYYGEELDRNDPREMSVSELVQGGILLRAERALRLECGCAREA